jgi:transcriptional regulator with XRE-family HTH domain
MTSAAENVPVVWRETLAANIRAERARASLSQTVLAELMRDIGFSHWLSQTVGASERGQRRVTAEEILGIAKVLGCPAGALMNVGGGGDTR